MSDAIANELVEQVSQAIAKRQPLNIIGGDSKKFYGRIAVGDSIKTAQHSGIIDYQPSELVITAKSGTPLWQINQLLAEHNQMLGFDPPLYANQATIGGAVASGLSGVSRAHLGGVRDFILGVKIINGLGNVLNFGGKVMKNVAGFDHSRLMVGAMGTLGLILEVSLRVIPIPEKSITLTKTIETQRQALEFFSHLASQALPITACAWFDNEVKIKLSSSEVAIDQAIKHIDGTLQSDETTFWTDLRDHRLPFFDNEAVLYRLIVPATAPLFPAHDQQLIDWGGMQRWIYKEFSLDDINDIKSVKGQLTKFRNADRSDDVFQHPEASKFVLHKKIKNSFDPHGIFNPGRLYKGL